MYDSRNRLSFIQRNKKRGLGAGAVVVPSFDPSDLPLFNWFKPENLVNDPNLSWKDSLTSCEIYSNSPRSIIQLNGNNVLDLTGWDPQITTLGSQFCHNVDYTIASIQQLGINSNRRIYTWHSSAGSGNVNFRFESDNQGQYAISNYTVLSGSTALEQLTGIGYFILIATYQFTTIGLLQSFIVKTYVRGNVYTLEVQANTANRFFSQSGIGTSGTGSIQLGEIIKFQGVLSQDNINKVGNWFMQKYPSADPWINI